MIGRQAILQRANPSRAKAGRRAARRGERLEETDAMRLMGTAKTATQVLQSLEAKRAANGGWVVPWPRPPEEFAGARMEDPAPGETLPRPNDRLRELQDHFLAIFDVGGSPADLRKAFARWPTVHPARRAKSPMQNFIDPLIRKANTCLLELEAKSRDETLLERTRDFARSALAIAEAHVVALRAEHTRATAAIAAVKAATGATGFNRELFAAQRTARDARDDLAAAELKVVECKYQLEAAERALEPAS